MRAADTRHIPSRSNTAGENASRTFGPPRRSISIRRPSRRQRPLSMAVFAVKNSGRMRERSSVRRKQKSRATGLKHPLEHSYVSHDERDQNGHAGPTGNRTRELFVAVFELNRPSAFTVFFLRLQRPTMPVAALHACLHLSLYHTVLPFCNYPHS